MYKVAVYLKGKEISTSQEWDTKKQAEEMKELYKVYFKSQGAKNFTFKIIEV